MQPGGIALTDNDAHAPAGIVQAGTGVGGLILLRTHFTKCGVGLLVAQGCAFLISAAPSIGNQPMHSASAAPSTEGNTQHAVESKPMPCGGGSCSFTECSAAVCALGGGKEGN
jgi:hypothetical protein